MTMVHTNQSAKGRVSSAYNCSRKMHSRRPRPARGALKGRLLPQNLLKGRIPSRPSSWFTRP